MATIKTSRHIICVQRAAFTLIELLVTLIIIAILVALLFVGWETIMKRAQATACAGNMRSMGIALMSYRTDHNGWFSPQGKPNRPGSGGGMQFTRDLVPQYLSVLPICPAAKKKLSKSESKDYASSKEWFQANGGTYALNAVVGQWRLENMPWPKYNNSWAQEWAKNPYSPSRMPFLLECVVATDASIWTTNPQLNDVLDGLPSLKIYPRSHGRNDDSLNFMFVDGHIELISRNDTRNVQPSDKHWIIDFNPNGRFHNWGEGGRFIAPNYMNTADFNAAYGP